MVAQPISFTRFGKSFSSPVTSSEALTAAGADFSVAKQPIFTLDPSLLEGTDSISVDVIKRAMIDGFSSTVRTDANYPLGIVKNTYGVVQNAKAFEFIDQMCTGGSNAPVIETAGVLNGGKRVFVAAKFPEPIRISSADDNIDLYVVVSTTHDGTGSVSVLVTPIRVICANTLALAFQHNSGRLNFKHTVNVNARLDLQNQQNASRAYQVLGLYDTYTKVFKQQLEAMKKIALDDTAIRNIVAETILAPDAFKAFKIGGIDNEEISTKGRNQFNAAMDSLYSGVGQEKLDAGTGLWLINGLTTHFQNGLTWKDEEKKFLSVTEGATADKVQKAYNLIALAA